MYLHVVEWLPKMLKSTYFRRRKITPQLGSFEASPSEIFSKNNNFSLWDMPKLYFFLDNRPLSYTFTKSINSIHPKFYSWTYLDPDHPRIFDTQCEEDYKLIPKVVQNSSEWKFGSSSIYAETTTMCLKAFFL